MSGLLGRNYNINEYRIKYNQIEKYTTQTKFTDPRDKIHNMHKTILLKYIQIHTQIRV